MSNSELLSQSILTVSKTEQVVNRLIQYLKEEDVKPGDTIPKEIVLSQNLNVSRPILREALSHLKLLGLVEARKKRGMILSEPDLTNTFEKLFLPKLFIDSTRQDIFELRLMLEIGIADALFKKITAEDIDLIEKLIEPESRLIKQKKTKKVINQLVEIDSIFHAHLYRITGNKVLQSLQKVLLPTIKYVITHQFEMDPLSYGKINHKDLLQILRTGTVNEFRIAMRSHLELHFAQL